MTNLIKANGHNERTSSGEFYEIVDTTFFYYYNDTEGRVLGIFEAEWDFEMDVDAAIGEFFKENAGYVEEIVTDHLEGIGYTEPIDLIIIDSHRYNFPAIEVPVDINN